MKTIATIGYEGATPEAFDATLKRAGVELVVDVRAVAISRRRGFSKTALANRLIGNGLAYVHLRGLGDPKPGREAARAGDLALFREIFGEHLNTPAAQLDLQSLRKLAAGRRVALLCYEAEADACHRTIVANSIAKLGNLAIVHLRVERGQSASGGRVRANHRSREGLAAA
jgi:uncharacterized protein (DUF488 family)